MYEAAFYGHQQMTQYIFQCDAWFDSLISPNLKTPLQMAMRTKQLVVPPMLSDLGRPNAQMLHDATALHTAAVGG